MLRMGLLPFIDVPILSFTCGLLVPIFGWKRIMIIRFGLLTFSFISRPDIFVGLYAMLEGVQIEGAKGMPPIWVLTYLISLLYVEALLLVVWFFKRYKKWLIF